MPLAILTREQLAKVRDAATRKADFYEARLDQRYADTTRRLIAGLRHTASDCQAAIDGCDASMRSVLFELDDDGDLARAAESYVPQVAA